MTKPISFTQAALKRALEAARKAGMKAILRPDGSLLFEERADDEPSTDRLERRREIVL